MSESNSGASGYTHIYMSFLTFTHLFLVITFILTVTFIFACLHGRKEGGRKFALCTQLRTVEVEHYRNRNQKRGDTTK